LLAEFLSFARDIEGHERVPRKSSRENTGRRYGFEQQPPKDKNESEKVLYFIWCDEDVT
jgi:hypothetical protein